MEKRKHLLSVFATLVMVVLAFGSTEPPEGGVGSSSKNSVESQFSSWDGSHRNVVKAIKESMNDPGSFEHVETRYKEYGDHIMVYTTFRGKNGFGGVVKDMVSAKVTKSGTVLYLE